MMTPEEIVRFAETEVGTRLRMWAAPAPNHIDYEEDEFTQQASFDLWIALRKRPELHKNTLSVIVSRSMGRLLRRRFGKDGSKAMVRMDTEALDHMISPDCESAFVLYDIFDYISSRLGKETGVILECYKRGASPTDIISALHMSVSVFYTKLNRIRELMHPLLEN